MPDVDVEWGSFKILVNGAEIAGGMGPYEFCKREAAHYALVYSKDGDVKVRLRRLGKRTVNASPRRSGGGSSA
jgi:hypothetical protein